MVANCTSRNKNNLGQYRIWDFQVKILLHLRLHKNSTNKMKKKMKHKLIKSTISLQCIPKMMKIATSQYWENQKHKKIHPIKNKNAPVQTTLNQMTKMSYKSTNKRKRITSKMRFVHFHITIFKNQFAINIHVTQSQRKNLIINQTFLSKISISSLVTHAGYTKFVC